MPEFNLNYENISVDYNANKEDTAGGNTLGGGDIILVDIHGGEGGSFAEIDESNLAGGGKTIAGWGVGGIEADDDDGDHDIIFDPDGDLLPPNKPTGGGGDDAPDSILWDLDGGHVPGGGSEYLVPWRRRGNEWPRTGFRSERLRGLCRYGHARWHG